jgi:transglutaminase-like putative cysteine protease
MRPSLPLFLSPFLSRAVFVASAPALIRRRPPHAVVVVAAVIGVFFVGSAPVAKAKGSAQEVPAQVLFAQDLVVNLGGEDVGTMSFRDTKDALGVTSLQRTTDLTLRRGSTTTHLWTQTTVQLGKNQEPLGYRFEKKDPGGTMTVDGRVIDGGRKLELWSRQNGAQVKNLVALPDGATFAVVAEHHARSAPKVGTTTQPTVLEELGAVVDLTTRVTQRKDGIFVVNVSFQGMTTEEEMDGQGRTLVARTPAIQLVAYPWGKAPPDVEKLLGQNKKADLLAISTWKVRPVPLPATRVVYRVKTPDAATFLVPEDARQRVLARTATTVDIEVRAGPSTTTTLSGAAKTRALSATPYEAVTDPRIQRAAKEATRGAVDDADRVARLSAFVFRHVAKKGLDRGYAPAIATLESRAGDCTEHSVLLSALLRAVGIPTRIVDGVVVDHDRAGYHEWVEVNLGRGFVAVDPTFNAWPAGPERLKLAEGSTLPDEQLGLSLAAARLLKTDLVVEVLSAE